MSYTRLCAALVSANLCSTALAHRRIHCSIYGLWTVVFNMQYTLRERKAR